MFYGQFINFRLLFCPAIILLGGVGCRDAGARKENLLKHQSTVTLNLVGDPSEAFQKVELFITEVDARAGDAWKSLAKPGRAYDLQNPAGREEALAQKVRLPKGDYREIRLKVDPARCSVKPRDGERRPLTLPPTLRDGIILKAEQGPSSNLIHDLILTVDTGRSLFRSQDAQGSYTFAPAARLLDREAMGVITGRIVDEQQQPLKAVQVMAQAGETEGRTLLRTVTTAQDGTFKLDLLPLNQMCYVVAQPRTDRTLFEARASEGFKPTRLDRKRAVDLGPFRVMACHPGPEGEVKGPLTPDQFDEVDLLKELPTGSSKGHFILRSLRTVPAPGGASSTFRFEDVPAGPCQVRVRRATFLPLGNGPAWHPVGVHTAEVKAGSARQKVDF